MRKCELKDGDELKKTRKLETIIRNRPESITAKPDDIEAISDLITSIELMDVALKAHAKIYPRVCISADIVGPDLVEAHVIAHDRMERELERLVEALNELRRKHSWL